MTAGLCLLLLISIAPVPSADEPVRIPAGDSGAVDVAEVVARLAERAGVEVARPEGALALPIGGLAGSLTKTLLEEGLGPDVAWTVGDRELIAAIRPGAMTPEGRPAFKARLEGLAARAREAARRRSAFGMRARPSYRPNDPARPTVCLVHGLNSTSAVFKHMVGPLEAAGFGVVLYDFPYNRDLDQTAPAFGRDWADFRKNSGDHRPWAVVTHSMGGLLARDYVEGGDYAGDVADLILIAPPNRGSGLAKAQALLQLSQGVKAIRRREARALSALADGVGEAADDMTPGSAFLTALNARPRRAGVRYHILAGDRGFLTAEARRRVELQARALMGAGGLVGGVARLAGGDFSSRLDEVTDGLGDGCVAVASTALEGVADRRVIHADHLELIRAPLLYPDPGPVACLPFVMERLKPEAPAKP